MNLIFVGANLPNALEMKFKKIENKEMFVE